MPVTTRSANAKIVNPLTHVASAAVTTNGAVAASEALFEGSEAVPDSALDGYYSISNIDGFEKWISKHKPILCQSALEQESPKTKVLVLDLDNTLISRGSESCDFWVNCNNGNCYSITIHPACITFLHEMGAHYARIAIYTSSSEVYATKIARQIVDRYTEAYPDDKNVPFFKIFTTSDCLLIDRCRFKDLLPFGSLDDIVFVDDDPYYSMRNQNDNVVQVRRYHGEESQAGGLMAIAPLLTFLSSVKSVSGTMRKLKKVWHGAGLVKIVQSTEGVTC